MVRIRAFFKQDSSILLVFALLFAILPYGQLNLLKTGELRYPTSHIMQVKQVSSDNQDFYTKLDEIGRKTGMTIYKTLTVNDQVTPFVFGAQSQLKGTTRNFNYLQKSPALDYYYLDGGNLAIFKNLLNQEKIDYDLHASSWQGIALDLLRPGYLRGDTFWIAVILFMISLFAMKIRHTKKYLIQQHLGRLHALIWQNYAFLIISYLIVGTAILTINGYLGTIFASSYAWMSCLVLPLLVAMMLIVDATYVIYLKRQSAIAIIKNHQTGSLFAWVWLFVLAVSMILATQSLVTIQKFFQASQAREANLVYWKSLSGFATIDSSMPDFIGDAGKMIGTDQESILVDQSALFKDYVHQWRQFDDAFPQEAKIRLKAPPESDPLYDNDPSYYNIPYPDFEHPGQLKTIDTRLAQHIYEVSPSLVEISEKMLPGTPKYYRNQAPITIYLPDRYKGQLETIKTLILANFYHDNHLLVDQVEVVSIPNDYELVNLNLAQLRSAEIPMTTIKQEIIVQYDYSQMPDVAEVNGQLYSSLLASYYDAKYMLNARETSGLGEHFIGYQDVLKPLLAYHNQEKQDLKRSICLTITLFIVQILVLYSYLKLQLMMIAKRLSIAIIFGKSYSSALVIRLIVPIITVALCYLYSIRLGVSIALASLIYAGYGLLFISMIGLVLLKLKRQLVIILKGEQELT